MRLFGFILLVILSGVVTVHLSQSSEIKQKQMTPERVHILNLDELKTTDLNRSPAQVHKWVINSNRVQLVSKEVERKIAAVKNKTNGFTATLFKSSDVTATDFIDLSDGLNELELTFQAGKTKEVTSIWLETK